ncbi:hypothetical protein DFS34DRAFT_640356 [Phlyctochytrium arcticum]|nr:hypothetical protein DFS34DRAFT_640331 [Phlyctochytrium arcticum]KAI9088703.1 hypothetical protein DFS34DRAFT_640356 [Phlyctochytrium arcticum]
MGCQWVLAILVVILSITLRLLKMLTRLYKFIYIEDLIEFMETDLFPDRPNVLDMYDHYVERDAMPPIHSVQLKATLP